MAEKSGLLGKLMAFMRGEVSAATLESYRRAGTTVHDMLHEAEAQRLNLKIQGLNPWTAPVATQAYLLCLWNAFTLQTLGDQFLDADYRANPGTVGYLPPKTAEQVFAFYDQVEGWVSRASQAQSNPLYRLDVDVPAELPAWSEVEPCPQSHLDGLRRMDCLRVSRIFCSNCDNWRRKRRVSSNMRSNCGVIECPLICMNGLKIM
jgi:hypothetical protein